MIDGAPPDVLEAADRLACSEVVVVNIGVDRADLLDAHWSYFYDPEVIFARLSAPHMQSTFNAPNGTGSLQAECYFSPKYKPLSMTLDEVTDRVIDDLVGAGSSATRTRSWSATPCTSGMPTSYSTMSGRKRWPAFMATLTSGDRLLRTLRRVGLPLDR